MFLVRDVFRCKPGKAGALVKIFKQVSEMTKSMEGFTSYRVMTDMVATYWTVVTEIEVDSIEHYTNMTRTFTSMPDVAELFKGYMDLVEGGHREIFKIK